MGAYLAVSTPEILALQFSVLSLDVGKRVGCEGKEGILINASRKVCVNQLMLCIQNFALFNQKRLNK